MKIQFFRTYLLIKQFTERAKNLQTKVKKKKSCFNSFLINVMGEKTEVTIDLRREWIDRQIDRYRYIYIYIYIYIKIGRQIDRQIDRQMDRQTDRQIKNDKK